MQDRRKGRDKEPEDDACRRYKNLATFSAVLHLILSGVLFLLCFTFSSDFGMLSFWLMTFG